MAPILCYVTDRAALPAQETALLDVIRFAIRAGVDWIQIREKNLSGRALAALAREAVAAARGSSTQILINGRLDMALAIGAGGVHLGSDALPVADVAAWCKTNLQRRGAPACAPPAGGDTGPVGGHVGPPLQAFLIGASCHSLDEAQAAEQDGAHYIFFGPVFSTPGKVPYGPPQGVARLTEVCRVVRIPVLAIGGITLENAPECLRAGAAGIAAIRLFQDASDLPALVSSLRKV